MAWPGLGSGTISDPYQVATTEHAVAMQDGTYNASHYFLLMNDVSVGLGFYSYSNLDGSTHRLTVSGNRLYPENWPNLYIVNASTYIKNTEFYFNDLIYAYAVQWNTVANITLNNLRFIFNPYYQSTSEEFPPIYTAFYGTCPSTWKISNIYVEGPISSVFTTVSCSLDNIQVVATKPVNGTQGFLTGQFNGYETHMKNIYVKFPKMYLAQAGVLSYYLGGTRNVVENCFIEGELQGAEVGAIAYIAKTDTSVFNCYFNGSFVDYNEDFTTNSINFHRSVNGGLKNCYAHIDSFKKQINHAYDVSVFDDLGFTDWYIPSRDEMTEMQTGASQVFNNVKYKGAFTNGYFTSSESNAANVYTYNYNGYQPAAKTGAYYRVILARNFTYDINDEPKVGQRYLGGTCFYKNASTLIGMMCGTSWIAEGAKLFNFGSSGTFLNTSTGLGSGITNTALIEAARNSSQGATNWRNYTYPALTNFSLYPMAPYPTANHFNNYCNVISKDSNISFSSYAGGEYVTDTSLRDPSTFINWDFTNVWQASTGKLMTLRDNPETPYVGVLSITRSGLQGLSIALRNYTDKLSDSSVGLIVELYGGAEIYDASGLTHNLTMTDASDFRLILKPYYLNGVTQIVPSFRDYYFYPYPQTAATYPSTIQNITLNAATVGMDIKLVHGCVLVNGYIYGCSRHNGAIIKINANNYSDYSTLLPTGTWSLDQIVYCNGYIWGQAGNKVIRIDPSTLAYKTAVFDMSLTQGSEPIMCSHDRFLYLASIQHVYKYDSSYFLGSDISANCPGGLIINASLGTYDSYSRGQWKIYNPTYPLYIGSSKGVVHSCLADGDYMYLAYTTRYGNFFDNSGFNASTGLSGHELHKININDMSTGSYVVIPKATDDMDQDLGYVYLGCEVQPQANPSTYGSGCSEFSVRKSDSKVSLLSRNEYPQAAPPFKQSYGVFRRGKYLIDLRTTGNIAVTNLADASLWSLSTPINKYTGDYLMPGSGIGNDMVIDYNKIYHFFTWAVSGGTPFPSGLYKMRFPSHLEMTAAPLVMTLDGSIL